MDAGAPESGPVVAAGAAAWGVYRVYSEEFSLPTLPNSTISSIVLISNLTTATLF